MYTFLSGGTGTPKLLQGFRQLVEDREIGVICNTGDDLSWNNLHVSPDLDTNLYLFSDKLDLNKFWGVKAETHNSLNTLRSLNQESWFQIGDKDLGLHIYRQKKLTEGSTLTEVTRHICENWEISAKILPMADQLLQSVIYTELGKFSFQEYFVKHRWQPSVSHVEYHGDASRTTNAVLHQLEEAKMIIIGPSNPVTSIGPIFAIKPIMETLKKHRSKVVAVSPIVNEKAFSGPTISLMKAVGIAPTVQGLAAHYKEIVGTMIIAEDDHTARKEIENLGIDVLCQSITLQNSDQKENLASSILELR